MKRRTFLQPSSPATGALMTVGLQVFSRTRRRPIDPSDMLVGAMLI